VKPRWIVLFDWDGTLVNSLETKIENASRLFSAEFNLPPQGIAAAYRRHSGIPRRQLFEAICAENGLPPLTEAHFERLSLDFSASNLARLTDPSNTGLVPQDTRLALAALRACAYPLYVSSAAVAEEIRLVARAFDLEAAFCEMLGSTPGFGKGPEHVNYVLCQQSARRGQIVFVGDEPLDVVLGRAAGVLTIAKIGTYPAGRLLEAGADHVVSSLSALPDLLSKQSQNL
jgi:phosphoglycolate phosphatase-like HAD superfamily hydrolase